MTSAFASLQAPVLEDTMELSSSPAGNQYDHDIDIDLGDYPAGANLTDDERMMDDAELPRPTTATDEMMDDEDPTLPAPVNEEVMHDGPDAFDSTAPEIDDEELIDYDERDYQAQLEASANNAAEELPTEIPPEPTEVQATEEPVDEEIVRTFEEKPGVDSTDVTQTTVEAVPVDPVVEAAAGGPTSAAATESETLAEEPDTIEATQTDNVISEAAVPGHDAGIVSKDDEAQVDNFTQVDNHTDDVIQKPMPQLPGTLDTSLRHVSDGPPTPTDTGLHPMIFKFGDDEMPLFKSNAQQDGLLKDDNLASVSLAQLIVSCRQRLSEKRGKASELEGQDLVLNFDHMGIMLFEGSRAASSTSLNEVVEIFTKLHENDGTADVPPLVLSLRPQPFSAMFDGLKRAAAEGTGMSTFLRSTDSDTFAHTEHDEAVQENHETEYDGEGNDDGGEDNSHGEDEHTGDYEFAFGEEQNHDGSYDEEKYEEGNQNTGQDYEDTEGYEGNQAYEENAEFQHADLPGPEDDLSQYDDDQYQEGTNPEGQDPSVDGNEHGEVVPPKSTASSDTIRGDATNEDTGEYDPEDLIDWDDDSDLTGIIEAFADEGHDDFSAFVADDETGYAPDASEEGENGQQNNQQTGTEEEDVEEAALQAEAEAFLNEGFDESAETGHDQTEGLEQYYDDAGADLLEFVEEPDDPQTDNIDETQEGYNHYEESEQFHTAFDVLEGTDDAQDDALTGDGEGHTNGEEQIPEDVINFDDDGDDETPASAVEGNNSPLGKRSFEEHADDDEFNFDEPDLKKARSG